MKISDEQLSAFLDRELSAEEMESVRDALHDDADLAGRLAQLTIAEELVKSHASSINEKPVPLALARLLQPDNVIALQPRRAPPSRHFALAASIALLIGFGAGYQLPHGTEASAEQWKQISAGLDGNLSGSEIRLDSDTVLLSRFTFQDRQDTFCRQFLLQSAEEVTENIACRGSEGWERVATAHTSRLYPDSYTPASGASLLDSTLDTMMRGNALSLEQEAELIAMEW